MSYRLRKSKQYPERCDCCSCWFEKGFVTRVKRRALPGQRVIEKACDTCKKNFNL